jgi:hypothetical protein
MPPLLFKPTGLVQPEELQDHPDYHDDADDIKDAVHTFSPAIDVLDIDFFNFLYPMKAMTRAIKASAFPVTSAAMAGAIDRSCHDCQCPTANSHHPS